MPGREKQESTQKQQSWNHGKQSKDERQSQKTPANYFNPESPDPSSHTQAIRCT